VETKATAAPTDPKHAAPKQPDPEPSAYSVLKDMLVERALSPFVEVGYLSRMLASAFFWGVRPPYRFRQVIAAMEFVGVGSIFIITLTSFFVGAVLSLQLVDGFRQFSAENQTGAVVGLGLSREIGPVFAALMVASRAGSAMTTELGSMRVTSQIDAMQTMAVNPVQYLIVPRLIAGLLMVPLLDIWFNIVGMFGAYLVAVHLMDIDGGIFLERMRWLVGWDDVYQGIVKAGVFGVAVTLIACRQGFYASGGAAGVGQATNRCVVHCAIAVLALDYVITSVMLGQGK
jgi:phospholipid/cholesterol/gamma-HCH transport system permease protein